MTKGLTKTLNGYVHALRQAVRTQLRLQQVYLDRYELSGCETVAAARVLRWQGDRLVGSELPPQ